MILQTAYKPVGKHLYVIRFFSQDLNLAYGFMARWLNNPHLNFCDDHFDEMATELAKECENAEAN